MVEHNAIEHLGEVGVEVELDGAALVASLLKLRLNTFQCLNANTHLYLFFKFI